MKRQRADVPPEVLSRLRLVCLDLPEVVEQAAWVGTRWVVGAGTAKSKSASKTKSKKNFAHVLMIEDGWPPAYAKAAGALARRAGGGAVCVLTFRAAGPALNAGRLARAPFFRPVWFPNIVGMVLDDATDWDVVGELLRRSYCVLAPKALAARVTAME